jgi:multidrug resistance protein MdtO
MPQGPLLAGGDDLIALPSKKVPIIVSGGLRSQDNLVFALKLSLCATACYVFNHAVAWPGISTSVATVFLTALSTTGAIKQKLLFRLILAQLIGGLALGIGASVFVFPQMDSITSLVVLVAVVAFIAAWCASGRYFGYIGLQIALAFYFVAFEGFSAPTELAPARDRFVGILVGLVAMWFVFDQIWPVRTVSIMRRELASVLRSGASLFHLGEGGQLQGHELRQANALRDQVGKTVAGLRSLNDGAEYEFGIDLDRQRHSSHAILRTAFAAVALFWNQLVALTNKDEDSLREPDLLMIRRAFAQELNAMADVVADKQAYLPAPRPDSPDLAIFDDPRYGEHARNIVNRFSELQSEVQSLNVEV